MAKDLKVGERVKVYGHIHADGSWVMTTWGGETGEVTQIMERLAGRGGVAVKLDDKEYKDRRFIVSTAQCVRLRPRKKHVARECWIEYQPNGKPWATHIEKPTYKLYAGHYLIHFREVLPEGGA